MEKTQEKKNTTTASAGEAHPEIFNNQALCGVLDLLDAGRCQVWLFNHLRPGRAGICCPGCGAELPERRKKTFREFRKTCCPACGLQFRATSGTVFDRAHLRPREAVLLAALLGAGATDAALSEALSRGRDTVKIWREKLEGQTLAALVWPLKK